MDEDIQNQKEQEIERGEVTQEQEAEVRADFKDTREAEVFYKNILEREKKRGSSHEEASRIALRETLTQLSKLMDRRTIRAVRSIQTGSEIVSSALSRIREEDAPGLKHFTAETLEAMRQAKERTQAARQQIGGLIEVVSGGSEPRSEETQAEMIKIRKEIEEGRKKESV
ncbi:MAG: hypothetical protein UU48_C0001G0133 [Candidatus Uhrbacteria bacterium GW2011_GWF2_41_16]|nr:MAG: hypothetical protein UU48_C0001G0133 [Candidatus Uhrbacteria bacterium GW2011_GWF2_41_16]HBP00379.1 hypothetical protein [Candidatus Uhrbacteria bacterium]